LRSFHIRHAKRESGQAIVTVPVHVIYYRVTAPGLVEIARVLHEKMDPRRHLLVVKAQD
jgi:toxin ParE1/3/4